MADPRKPRAAGARTLPLEPVDAGLAVTERHCGVALIAARRGRIADTLLLCERHFGLVGADGPRAAIGERYRLIGAGPGRWLFMDTTPGAAWLEPVDAALSSAATIFDQSSGYALLEVSGEASERLLQKGFFVDLAMRSFPPGSCAWAPVAQINVALWRIAPDRFGLAVPKSYAASFWHWFETATSFLSLPFSRAA